jgi:hypothetical protein
MGEVVDVRPSREEPYHAGRLFQRLQGIAFQLAPQ